MSFLLTHKTSLNKKNNNKLKEYFSQNRRKTYRLDENQKLNAIIGGKKKGKKRGPCRCFYIN
jgi:hypothetical protein